MTIATVGELLKTCAYYCTRCAHCIPSVTMFYCEVYQITDEYTPDKILLTIDDNKISLICEKFTKADDNAQKMIN